ncbi:MAG: hypothetical protein WCY19_00730 [Candidatus Gastranaerophilaceae bacterium]
MNINKTSNAPLSRVKNQPSFGSGFTTKIGQGLSKGGYFRKFSDAFEPYKFTLSTAGLMTVLYGATVVPRYIQAYDKYDRREILRRDVTSITAILFFATGLSRGFSKLCSKISGFALSFKPEKNVKFVDKLRNWLHPTKGIEVFNSGQIVGKYSQVDGYEKGMAGFCEFIKGNGGNLKKVLKFDPVVRENTSKILAKIGKNLKSASDEEIINAFGKEAKNSAELNKIYDIFKSSKNRYVKVAKFMNSSFGFIATFILVPNFMIWISKSNERMTKKRRAADLNAAEAKKQAQNNSNESNLIKAAKASTSV